MSKLQQAQKFNDTIFELLKIIHSLSDSTEKYNVDKIRNRLFILLSTGGKESLISLASPFYTTFSDLIIDRDEDFFASYELDEEYGEFTNLFRLVQGKYVKMSKNEKDYLYGKVKLTLEYWLEY